MSQNSFGHILRMTSFGESHGVALGVVVDGCPSGIPLSTDDLMVELRRRRPGQSAATTARREEDRPEILSGVFEGLTTGMPIAAVVRNTDHRSQDYEHLRHHIRPGHADETWAAKYVHRDHRGGGRASGRETLSRVMAGVIAAKILPSSVNITAHALQVGPHRAQTFDAAVIEENPMRCADPQVAEEMLAHVLKLKEENDSTGGLVEVRVEKPPASLGEPVFGKLKAMLAQGIMSIPAVTGFSYGTGFGAVEQRGTEYVSDRRHFGGILGGLSTGEDITLHVSIKPTSSIQDVARAGRHDPCIVPRVIPVIESMVAFVLADALLMHRAGSGRS